MVDSSLKSSELSPMLQQYLQIKDSHKDCILFFRMGDFYEMFFEDAIIASSILGVVLTKRGTVKSQEVPMCGIPYHSYETYINRLVSRGYKVAICEQLEKPEEAKKRGNKSVVNRGVVRIITPGTITEDSLLESDSYNYLVSIYLSGNKVFVAWMDISTGDFYVKIAPKEEINTCLHSIYPKEILVEEGFDTSILSEEFRSLITPCSKDNFSKSNCKNLLIRTFKNQQHLLADFEMGELVSCGALVHYIYLTQKDISNIFVPKRSLSSKFVKIDSFTRRSLEILKSYNGSTEGSLKSTINYTCTSQGSRLLGSIISNPLLDVDEINARLDAVEYLVINKSNLADLRTVLKKIPDMERAIGRISLNRGNPVDLAILRTALKFFIQIKGIFFNSDLPKYLLHTVEMFAYHNNLITILEEAIVDELPLNYKEGSIVKAGYNKILDEYKNKKFALLRQLSVLQEKYNTKLGVSNLKISYNNLVGYFIESPVKNTSLFNENKEFNHKGTLANSIRYTTKELMELEAELSKSNNQFYSYETEIINNILQQVLGEKEALYASSKALAMIDVFASFATMAIDTNCIRPVVNNSLSLNIIEGRHGVVERSLKKNLEQIFIPNDCIMADKNIFLITGPNMSGKSTFLRQNAIIIIMAQVGSFVPAKVAEVGLVDAIYSRVGASDDLFKGQSTFMVEMLELGTILNNATEKSFIILDEIGRGTSTYDGLSIAWATLEYISTYIKARTLFATHYHELIKLEQILHNMECYYVQTEEANNNIIFMHAIIKGNITKSYGIEVAKMAGLPNKVIQKAQSMLNYLEKNANKKQSMELLPLFATVKHEEILPSQYNAFIEELRNIDIDNFTPKEALDFLYAIKKKILTGSNKYSIKDD